MNKNLIPFLFLLLLLLLSACQPQTITVEKDGEVEAVEVAEDSPSAIGSEDDSGALPPPINSGSKVTTPTQTNEDAPKIDILFIIEQSADTAVSLSELEENWENIIQLMSALPGQPEVKYASLFFEPNRELPFSSVDFTLSPLWDDLMPDNGTTVNGSEGITDVATQLSWTGIDNHQLVFILVSAATFDDTFLIGTENTYYFPIIAEDIIASGEDLGDFETIMNDVNGRLIQLTDNNQTNLSEQLILSVIEVIIQQNDTSIDSGETNE